MTNENEGSILNFPIKSRWELDNIYTDDPYRGIKTKEKVEEEWDAFFYDIRERAQIILDENSDKFSENPSKTLANFMEAFKSIYIEITIEDQIKAVVEGVETAIEIAKKNNLEILVIVENGSSDALLAMSVVRELEDKRKIDQGFKYRVIRTYPRDKNNDLTGEHLCLVVDDAAYTGYQKMSLATAISHRWHPKKCIFSFGGCSTAAVNRIKSKVDPDGDLVTIIYQQEIPDLANEIRKIDGKNGEAMKLAKLMFPNRVNNDGDLNDDIVGAFTTLKVPDNVSIPPELRPKNMPEAKMNPDAL